LALTSQIPANLITGTGVAGQVAYWNGTNSQAGSNNLVWDNANIKLGIGTNTPEGTGLTVAGGGVLVSLDSGAARKVLELYATSTGAKVSSTYVGASSYGSLELLTSNLPRLTIADTGAATFSTSASVGGLNLSATYATKLGLYNPSGSANMELGNAINTNGSIVSRLVSINANNGNTGNESSVNFIGVASIETQLVSTSNNASGTSGANILFLTKADGGTLGERMRITSGGNVGIACTPEVPFEVHAGRTTNPPALGTKGGTMALLYNDSANGSYGLLVGLAGANTYIQSQRTDGDATAYNLLLQPNGGKVNIGTGSPDGTLTINSTTTSLSVITNADASAKAGYFWHQATSGDNQLIQFFTETAANQRGTISFNRAAGVVVYGTTSDYRLKTEVEDFNALEIVCNLKPKEFRIGDAEQKSIGFIAHELQEFFPQAVHGEKDAEDENEKPIYQGVDYSQLTGLLTKAIQELKTEIDSLKNQIK
jgi:hypothetical protein